jgi:protein-S-isoprenylcysteine O-methyltransferase Ste14
MRRPYAILWSAIFLVLVPGSLAVLVPWLISRWQFAPPFFGFAGFRVIGVILIILGAPVLLNSFARFALDGLGTPAPMAPPTKLVVTGYYRHVRNPMYVSALLIVAGQALLFANVGLLEYAAAVWFGAHLFVLFYEEPTLRKKFGAQYNAFCAAVPRWIPRLTPWRGENASADSH